MGQVTIEIPQNVNRRYLVKDTKRGEKLLSDLEEFEKKTTLETITLQLPYDLDAIDEREAIGIWADRVESAEEIARKVREANRKTT